MLNEDLYAQILKAVVRHEQKSFDEVKNYKRDVGLGERAKTTAFGYYQLNDEWPENISYKEKVLLHSKIIYEGTEVMLPDLTIAKEYFKQFPVMQKFEEITL